MPIKNRISKPALALLSKLQGAGYEAYLVGGAVRDLLLDIEPKDYDVATNATPEETCNVFGRRARIIGRRFRLVHVYMGGGVFEVSTFRREPTLEERKGRDSDSGLMVWRDNVFGSLEDDARRRDFTVNAVYYDPLNNDREFVDYVAGMADLKEGIVRAIGDPATRIVEDPVRMLRACKLVGQYGLVVESELQQEICRNAATLSLSSPARLLEEIYKILLKPYTRTTFDACFRCGVLHHLLPTLGDQWQTAPGRFAQALLQTRDHELKAQRISPSRVTGLTALILPFIEAEYGEPQEHRLWANFGGIDKLIHSRIREFYQPYRVPRYTTAKTRDVLLLQPKFFNRRMLRRLPRHPEYRRAHEMFGVFAKAAEQESRFFEMWPPPDTDAAKGGPRPRRRRRSKPVAGDISGDELG